MKIRRTQRLIGAAFWLGALLLAGCSFGGSNATPIATAASSTATVTPPSLTPTATATTPTAEVAFFNARPIEVVVGRIELPSDLALNIARDGELRRVHRLASGELETRLLFDPFAYSSTRMLAYQGLLLSGPALPAGQLAISACSSGECPGIGTASEDARATVFRSIDGGVTWSAGTELDGIARVVGSDGGSELLMQRLPREGDARTDRLEWWPSGRVVDAPVARSPGRSAVTLNDGRIGWWTSDGDALVDADGGTLLDLDAELSGGSIGRGVGVLPNADGSRLVVTWVEQSPDGSTEAWRWSVYDLQNGRYEATDILEAPFQRLPAAWLSESTLLLSGDLTWDALGEEAVTPELPRLPVILDVVEGTATAIEVPGGTLGDGWVVAAQRGPFAEINAGAGDCLNLRTAPSLDGGVLRCVAHATLLERLTPIEDNWVLVRTSDGVEGWVSGEFVRRPGQTNIATPGPATKPTPAANE